MGTFIKLHGHFIKPLELVQQLGPCLFARYERCTRPNCHDRQEGGRKEHETLTFPFENVLRKRGTLLQSSVGLLLFLCLVVGLEPLDFQRPLLILRQ
eukprot:COSAG01_NODE_7142_length_3332_cov_319.946489_3_plen_97_part_00